MLFSVVVVPIYIPINSGRMFYFLHILIISCVSDNSQSNRHEVISNCGFDMHFTDG